MTRTRQRLRVSGTVQGVGFRPFVYRQATALGLDGFVRNDSAGVLIEVEGADEHVAALARALVHEPPPLARVVDVTTETVAVRGERGFRIDESEAGGAPTAPVSVDTATCAECLAEVADPTDRRHRYPFTNCTNCGPRYTIVQGIPYDRPATTMATFTMCPACQAEYDDPGDRRFHAQPNACAACGPRLCWCTADGVERAEGDSALSAAIAALRAGSVLAVKGIGGYHLAVLASDDAAVAELRRRKARDDKPFAVLVPDITAAETLAVLDADAIEALRSARRPIVLVPRRDGAPIAAGVAPGLPEVGLLLPYSALHHLLVEGVGEPIVLTSGNLSDEPIAHEDDDARVRLGALVDGLLTHDRPIHIRCDDSVARAGGGRVRLLRRSRGYAPEPMALPVPARRAVLAVGAELKSTVAVARDGFVVATHHIGDLEHLATYRAFLQAVDHLRRLYAVEPTVVAHDLHPEYLSSKWAADLDVDTLAVQHHHAHVAACMVEHGRVEPVVGLAFDGIGFGDDGTLWGGEVLVASFDGYERAAHLRTVPLPGGGAAIREPWRMAAVWAALAGRPDDRAVAAAADDSTRAAVEALAGLRSTVQTSSAGRLFDAVAVLLGGGPRVTYEAQAAIGLEALARTIARADAPTYAGTVGVAGGVIDPAELVAAVLDERDRGVPAATVAAGFHEALGRAAADVAATVAHDRGIDAVVLTGGVFQNARLTEIVEEALTAQGLTVLVPEAIPANDGGISIGQAAIAALRSA